MRRACLLAAAAALAAGCAGGKVVPGPYKNGYAVEAVAASPDSARRQAVSQFFDLFLSSAAQAGAAKTLDEKVLSKAGSFVLREQAEGAGGKVRLRALVSYALLGRELDSLGLIRPEGIKGKPKVLVSLRETRPGTATDAGKAEGRASDALRRALLERGYAVIDMSDALNGGGGHPGSREEALAAGRKSGADVIVTGTASTSRGVDDRLGGYGSARALIAAQAETAAAKPAASIEQEASAVDVRAEDAAAKALESAGELAADKLHAALGGLFQERLEYTVGVLNLGNLDRARELAAAMRELPPVAAVALDTIAGTDVRLKLFVDRLGADELTAELLKLKKFRLQVRSVEPDVGYVELSSGEVY